MAADPRALAAVAPDDRPTVHALVRAMRSKARVPIYVLCGPDVTVGPVVDAVVSATGAERISLAAWIGQSPHIGWRRPDELLPEAVAELGSTRGPALVLDDAQPVARTASGWSVTGLRAVMLRSVARPMVLVLRASDCEPLRGMLEGDGRHRVFVVGRAGAVG